MFNFKPKIRTVSVPVKKQPTNPPAPQRKSSSTPTSNAPASTSSQPKKSAKAHVNGQINGHSVPPPKKTPERQSLAVKNPNRKRKATTPSTPQFASSSSESESDDDDSVRKRQKTSSSLEPDFRKILEPDWTRSLLDVSNDGDKLAMIHGADMTCGDSAKDFGPAFTASEGSFVVELQYPSASPPER
jgi:H3 lysine-79-specific histone-lysine N-methyltransferase